MANLNLILFGVGAVALLISLVMLIVQLTKGTNKINGGLVGLLVIGVTFLIAGIVIPPSDSVGEVPTSEGIAGGNDQIVLRSKARIARTIQQKMKQASLH